MKKKYIYNPVGVCCKEIRLVLDDDYIFEVTFVGGCPGNLNALKTILEHKKYTDFVGLFKDNSCGSRDVSCMKSFDYMLSLIDEDIKGTSEYPFVSEVLD